MIILTCANSDQAKKDNGETHKNFSFRGVIGETVKQADECGYVSEVYDLGSLGMGQPYTIEDKSFAEKGYYEKEVVAGYKSKSLFKPEIVKMCMEKHDDIVAYLDGDAQLLGCLNEVNTDDYDIGVTLRDEDEIKSEWHQAHIDIVRFVNAGVIFFRPTEVAKGFVETWHDLTNEVGNDQMALNKLTCPEDYPQVGGVKTINGVRVKYFPCRKYNYYYFGDSWNDDVKIFHFKGPVRGYYPFCWKKRIYCTSVAPVVNNVKGVIKKWLAMG
ncbi:MAG: putative nucleotide-diphospho-sugar transferase [Thermodesulfobacteriota bacterium]